MILKFDNLMIFLLACALILRVDSLAWAVPNLQEMRAQQETQLENMKRQMEVQNFIQQRTSLIAQYKVTIADKNEANRRLKKAQAQYKSAIQQLKSAKEQLNDIESRLKAARANISAGTTAQNEQILKLEKTRDKLFLFIRDYQTNQDREYNAMSAMENQYQQLDRKAQILRQRANSIETQIQFITSQ